MTEPPQGPRSFWPPGASIWLQAWAEGTVELLLVGGALALALLGTFLIARAPLLRFFFASGGALLLAALALALGISSALLLWRQGARARARAAGVAEVPLAKGAGSLRIAAPEATPDSPDLLYLLHVEPRGTQRFLPPWSELARVEVLPRAQRGVFGWRQAWPSARVRFVWLEPLADDARDGEAHEDEGEAAREGEAGRAGDDREAGRAGDDCEATRAGEEREDEAREARTAREGEAHEARTGREGAAQAGEDETADGSPAVADGSPAVAEGSPADADGSPAELVRHEETFELEPWAADGFLRWCVLEGVEVHDPGGDYPDVGAAKAAFGAELFWPPPRGAALRYFAGFAVTVLAACALPSAVLLIGEARRAPGALDFASHIIWMARPVAELTGMICFGAVGLTVLQVAFLRVKVLRAARRFQLPPGERLLALCYARTRRAWPPLPPPAPPQAPAEADAETPPQESPEDERRAPFEAKDPATTAAGEEEPSAGELSSPLTAPLGGRPAASKSAASTSGGEEPAASALERPPASDSLAPAPAPAPASEVAGADSPAPASEGAGADLESGVDDAEAASEPELGVFPPGPVSAGAAWGEFVAITDARILQLLFGEGRNMVLEVCRREDLIRWADLAPARHPLLAALRYLRSDGFGLRLWTRDGRELQITSEVLFHGPLRTWLEEVAGYQIEDWGYLPLDQEGWVRSERDPRRAELLPPVKPGDSEPPAGGEALRLDSSP